MQGYRQGDGRDKSCQSAQLLRYHRGPDNRLRKEFGSRPVPFLKIRADNKLARVSVVMLHVKTVALISSPCLNGAIAPQHTVVVLKCALNIEEFDHY